MKFSISAKELHDAVAACAKAACDRSKYGREGLRHVEITSTESAVTITALDGFVLLQKTLPIERGEPGTVVVNPHYLTSALKNCLGAATLETDGDSLHVQTEIGETSIRLYTEAPFPDLKKIWPNASRESTTIYVNPKLLVSILQGMGKGTVSLNIPHNPCHPITIETTPGGDTIRGLVLPIRINK